MEIKKRGNRKKPVVKPRGTPRGGGMGIRRTVRPGYRQTNTGVGGYEGSASLRRAEQRHIPGMGKPIPKQGDIDYEKWIRGMEMNARTGKLQLKRKRARNLRPS